MFKIDLKSSIFRKIEDFYYVLETVAISSNESEFENSIWQ